MSRHEVKTPTRDGVRTASVFTPIDKVGPWPAVLFFMDGFGIRPVMWEMDQRLYVAGAIEDNSFPDKQKIRLV